MHTKTTGKLIFKTAIQSSTQPLLCLGIEAHIAPCAQISVVPTVDITDWGGKGGVKSNEFYYYVSQP